MALAYGMDRKTFRKKLEYHEIFLPNGLISPADQRRIYDKLGMPDKKIPG
ncbi:hypothetical protein ADIS_1799 [Lunatimonas lonarensis]|uniref:Uncharacterized protein n=1 Tax=Lunatimonas lonarensis TaxID=1232681 RepID=R7ZTY2_9BACT|nr:hypothetical protein ADIS_1799 [Lunatimonas lonarensis]